MSKGTVILIALLVLCGTNLYSFLLMRKDKNCARKGKWRVKESSLFLAAACFGGLGGILGMKLLRHKTKHWYFRVFFPVLLGLQMILLGAGAYFLFI